MSASGRFIAWQQEQTSLSAELESQADGELSALGLGCVKTRFRGKPIEWISHSDRDLAHRDSSAGSNSIDLRKTILAVSELWEFPHCQGQKMTTTELKPISQV